MLPSEPARRMYKTYFRPILMNGAETLTLAEKHSSRIQGAEMKFLSKRNFEEECIEMMEEETWND